jgi:ABC-type amino acid transport system permease subunit
LSKNENVTVKYGAGPLAVATLVGVLSSHARHGRYISSLQTIITVAVTPLIAFCTFIVTYFIISMLDIGHHTPAVDVSVFAFNFHSSSNHRAMVRASFLRAEEAFVSQA